LSAAPLRVSSLRLIPLLLIATLALATSGTVSAVETPADSAPADSAPASTESESEAGVSYWNEVRPIFQAHCQGCHQPAKTSGEYVMTSFEAMVAGGESGEKAIVPHDPSNSYLMQQIIPADGQAAMPQGEPPLSAEQLATIKNWIDQGARDDTPASAVQRFDADHPPQYAALPVITTVAFSRDGKLLAIGGYHEVLLHDVSQVLAGAESLVARLVGMSERIESVAFSPDGTQLAVVGGSPGRLGEVQIWNVAERSLAHSIPVTYDTCYGASWSPDGRLLAFGCPDNSVRVIKAESGQQVLFNGAHNDWVLDTVFSIDAKHLVSVSRDRSMKLIEVATERFIDNITSITPGALKGGLHAVDRHPQNNDLLIGGSDGVPKTYRMFREQDRKIGDDFNLIKKYPEMPGRIFDVAYRADGQQLVAGSSYNGAGHVHVFSVESAERIAAMQEIEGAIYCIAFAPDGSLVASGGFSGEVYLHDPQTGQRKIAFVPVPIDSIP
jgi:mono/diheme cytochrome c family protein